MSNIRSSSVVLPLIVAVALVTVSYLILRSSKKPATDEDTKNKTAGIVEPRVKHAKEPVRDDAKTVTNVPLTEAQPPEQPPEQPSEHAGDKVKVDAPHGSKQRVHFEEGEHEEVISCEPAAVNLASADVKGSEVDKSYDTREPVALAFEKHAVEESCAVGEPRVSEEQQELDEMHAEFQNKDPTNSDATGDSGYEEGEVQAVQAARVVAAPSILNWMANEFIPSSTPPSPQLDSPDRVGHEGNGFNATLQNYGPAIKKIRCKYWPRCTNKNCKFVHPWQPCRNDRYCQYGEKCIFIHSADGVPIDYIDPMRRKSRSSRNSLHDQFVREDRNGNGR